jgi:hypothetical protein
VLAAAILNVETPTEAAPTEAVRLVVARNLVRIAAPNEAQPVAQGARPAHLVKALQVAKEAHCAAHYAAHSVVHCEVPE